MEMDPRDCTLCSGPICDSKIISCGHTFCKKCLLGLEEPLECPKCSRAFESVDLLPPNFGFFEKMENRETECDNCLEAFATLWCEDCALGTHYCSTCDAHVHSANALKGHQRVYFNGQSVSSKCVSHNKYSDGYCVDCKEFVCLDCIIDTHQLHNLQNFRSYAEGKKEELNKFMRSFKGPLLDIIKDVELDKVRNEKNIKLLMVKGQRLERQNQKYDQILCAVNRELAKYKTSEAALTTSLGKLRFSYFTDEQNVNILKEQIQEVLQTVTINNGLLKKHEKEKENAEISRERKIRAKIELLEKQLAQIEKSKKRKIENKIYTKRLERNKRKKIEEKKEEKEKKMKRKECEETTENVQQKKVKTD